MIKERDALPTDQTNAERVFKMIQELIDLNPGIENNIWAAGMWTCLIDSYVDSGFTYEMFCDELDNIRNHYKKYFIE